MPAIRFRGRQERDKLRNCINKLKAALWTFIREVSPQLLPDNPPTPITTEILLRLTDAEQIKPGTPEEAEFWKDVIADPDGAVFEPEGTWRVSLAELESLAVLLQMEEPYQDPPVLTFSPKVSARRALVAALMVEGLHRERDDRPLTNLDIALCLWAVGADYGEQPDFGKFRQGIRDDIRYLKSGNMPLVDLLPIIPKTQSLH